MEGKGSVISSFPELFCAGPSTPGSLFCLDAVTWLICRSRCSTVHDNSSRPVEIVDSDASAFIRG